MKSTGMFLPFLLTWTEKAQVFDVLCSCKRVCICSGALPSDGVGALRCDPVRELPPIYRANCVLSPENELLTYFASCTTPSFNTPS